MEILMKIIRDNDFTFWWPVDMEYHKKVNGEWYIEVILGAILTQNTKWNFAERNINILKERGFVFRLKNLLNLDIKDLTVPMKERKLRTIKELANSIINEYGSFEELKKKDIDEIRDFLLNINGIGYETSDVIILYSFEKPIFVIDNYTRRLLYENEEIERLSINYDKLRVMIEEYIRNNYEKILKIFEEKLRKVNCNKYINYPLNPCKISENYENNLVIIYKELHGMIDMFMKTKDKKRR